MYGLIKAASWAVTGFSSTAMDESTSVRSATLESMIALGDETRIFELLLLFDRVAAVDDRAAAMAEPDSRSSA
jgi:HEAT repeat protein